MTAAQSCVLVTTSSFDVANNAALEKLTRSGFRIVTNPYARRLTEDEIHDLIRELNPAGLIAGVEPLTRRVLQASTQLKVISRCGTGIENVDLAAAKESGITVRNTPDAPTRAVAELTVGSMLNLLRQIGTSDRSIRSGGFQKPMGRLLGACTVGIIGYGRIGREVARLCRAFGAGVLVYDVHRPAAAQDVTVTDLDTLLTTADVLSLHIPGTGEPGYFIDAARLARMKKGAFLINHARGNLVDEAALHTALTSGHLTGAALDVFENEPYQGPLAKLENVVLTAQIGSYAVEVRQAMEMEAAENLLDEFTKLRIL